MASLGKGETRVVALIGPFHSGKTTLLESIAVVTGATHRKGQNGSRLLGDQSPESKAREMGIDLNALTTEFLGDNYCFIDCPGSVEFLQESLNVLPLVDAAIIVTEADDAKILALAPLFKALEDAGIPRFVMVNKIDRANGSISDLVEGFSRVSNVPVVLRHIPIREGEEIKGYVDLASSKARVYKPGEASQIIDIPEDISDRLELDRFAMLEQLADFDDALLEKLLEDMEVEAEEVYTDLASDVQEGFIVPVFLGAALYDEGTRRLLKALRHELPPFKATLERLGAHERPPKILAQVMKTMHTQHAGKLSLVRLLNGQLSDGDEVNGEKISGLFTLNGQDVLKTTAAWPGDVVGLGRLEQAQTGDTLSNTGRAILPMADVLQPVYAHALHVDNRNDEVKLSGALNKLCEEDLSLNAHHDRDTQELVLMGQGEVHLNVAIDRLKSRFGITVSTSVPQVHYKETIRKSTTHHARHKKQSGGHGQFGDVVMEIRPLSPGEGFQFTETIHGGSIPKQYIPSVESGVRDYLTSGPLGFPVVDVGVTLLDGKYHAVDSSDMAFQIAGRMAMSEALPGCTPVLLEPIHHVKIHVPSEFTAKVNSLVATRRGHILGFDTRPGWTGWDTVEAHIPEAETRDLIIELRSLTSGAGTFESQYDHLAELSGRIADQVISARASA
ncbi:MAG: elongation factor G [Sphingomonadales bacterium]|jgi:elongation factor G